MSTAVLISIRPKWCDLIASGKKTIEVRKTKPNLPTPFKCYIYQTVPKSGDWNEHDGRVVGEFTCDSIEPHRLLYPAYQCEVDQTLLKESCLTYTELHNYVGSGNRFYGLHISELTIYDKPRELSEFRRRCPNDLYCESCAMFNMNTETCGNSALSDRRGAGAMWRN